MGKDDLAGAWNLVSFETRRSDGHTDYPFGKNAQGTLIYEPGGKFSVQLGRPGRPVFASGDIHDGTDAEVRAAYEGYIAYHGDYDVNDTEKYVTHNVGLSLFPNWSGGAQRRYYELSGDVLTLSTPPTPFRGGEVIGVLVWDRAS